MYYFLGVVFLVFKWVWSWFGLIPLNRGRKNIKNPKKNLHPGTLTPEREPAQPSAAADAMNAEAEPKELLWLVWVEHK